MNLLPKSAQEFGSADYWEKFFQQRGKQAFEWYGTYLQLCGVLHKYIRPREKVSATPQPGAAARPRDSLLLKTCSSQAPSPSSSCRESPRRGAERLSDSA